MQHWRWKCIPAFSALWHVNKHPLPDLAWHSKTSFPQIILLALLKLNLQTHPIFKSPSRVRAHLKWPDQVETLLLVAVSRTAHPRCDLISNISACRISVAVTPPGCVSACCLVRDMKLEMARKQTLPFLQTLVYTRAHTTAISSWQADGGSWLVVRRGWDKSDVSVWEWCERACSTSRKAQTEVLIRTLRASFWISCLNWLCLLSKLACLRVSVSLW